jgi:hypothetical protein
MIREEVWEIIEDSRQSGQVLPTLNATFLTLIPKEERVSPQAVQAYFFMQHHLQTTHKGNSPQTQAPPSFHHLS